MYTIRIREVSHGEISFDTLEEAKEWYEKRGFGDVHWYYTDENCELEKETNLLNEDISKEVNWL
mgnify:FL=1